MIDTQTEAAVISDIQSAANNEQKNPLAALYEQSLHADDTKMPEEPPPFSPEQSSASAQQMELLREQIEKMQAGITDTTTAPDYEVPLPLSMNTDVENANQSHKAPPIQKGEKKGIWDWPQKKIDEFIAQLQSKGIIPMVGKIIKTPGNIIKSGVNWIGRGIKKLWTAGDAPRTRTPVNSPPEPHLVV